MTPRIPRGWAQVYQRGDGVWLHHPEWHTDSEPYKRAGSRGELHPESTYIRRTDPSVPADPNECLRLEDEAAPQSAASVDTALRALADELAAPAVQVAEPDHAPDAEPMVPGMMRLKTERAHYAPLGAFGFQPNDAGWGTFVFAQEADRPMVDGRPFAEFAAAYTAAWEYTERCRAEIAEEVRLADDPPAPDLGEWPGKPDVPPDNVRTVEILTPHGACPAHFMDDDDGLWVVGLENYRDGAPIDPADVLAWREVPHAIVDKDGRVTGVRRG